MLHRHGKEPDVDLSALERAEQLEWLSAELYEMAASKFSGDREVRALFQRLRQEEEQHAYRLRMLRSQCMKDATLGRGLVLDASLFARLLETGAQVKKRLASEELSLAGLLALFVELENAFSCAHAESLTAEADPKLRTLFESLAKQDEQHRLLLDDLAGQGSRRAGQAKPVTP